MNLLPATSLFAHPHIGHDGSAHKTINFSESALNETSVLRVQEATGEKDEGRWPCRGLGAKKDPGLLTTTHRVRVGGNKLRQERIELSGGDPLIPRRQSNLQRGYQLFQVTPGSRGNIHAWRPRNVSKILINFPLQIPPSVVIEEVPFIESQN
jgi:hypothetical protein